MIVTTPRQTNPHPAGMLGLCSITKRMVIVVIAPATTAKLIERRRGLQICATRLFTDRPSIANSALRHSVARGDDSKIADVVEMSRLFTCLHTSYFAAMNVIVASFLLPEFDSKLQSQAQNVPRTATKDSMNRVVIHSHIQQVKD